MLVSAVLLLEAPASAPSTPYLGRAAHALFLRVVEAADACVAASLHQDVDHKPFTVSGLVRRPVARAEAGAIPAESCFLRFTTYEEGLSRLVTDVTLPKLPSAIELEGIPFAVKGVTQDASEHPWAGRCTYAELARPLLAEKTSGSVQLVFASPTTFRSGGHRNIPLPLPGLVFGSLVDRWNAFSPLSIPLEVRRYAEECLAITGCSIGTRLVEVAGGKQVGFVGRCSYVALNRDPYWWRLVNVLADFAKFGGVGYKTTMGMGQARRLQARPPSGRAGVGARRNDMLP